MTRLGEGWKKQEQATGRKVIGGYDNQITRVRPELRSVTSLARHEPVLRTLKQLSGRDFNFDQQAWRQWWEAEGRQLHGESDAARLPDPPAVKQAGPAKPADIDGPEAQQ